MLFDKEFFVKKTGNHVHSKYFLQRQNAWNEKNLISLMDSYYAKYKQ